MTYLNIIYLLKTQSLTSFSAYDVVFIYWVYALVCFRQSLMIDDVILSILRTIFVDGRFLNHRFIATVFEFSIIDVKQERKQPRWNFA